MERRCLACGKEALRRAGATLFAPAGQRRCVVGRAPGFCHGWSLGKEAPRAHRSLTGARGTGNGGDAGLCPDPPGSARTRLRT